MISLRFKKNITIRYQNSQLDDECSTFRNMTKILKILNIDKYQLKNLTNQAEQWTEKHMSTLKYIRFNEKSAIVDEQLTLFLYKINTLMFDDFKINQIFNILIVVIQWMFYNRRCSEQRHVKQIDTSFTHIQTSFTSYSDDQSFIIIHKIVKIQRASSASEFSQSQKVMSFIRILKDIELHVMMSSHLNLIILKETLKMSLTLIKDVLDHDLHDDKDWFYNVLFQMWIKLLKDDISYIEMNTIIYIIDDEILKINSDRTFWTLLRDVLNQSNHAACFNVIRATSYSDRSETYVCKQWTNDQCRTHRQCFINLSFSSRAHKIH